MEITEGRVGDVVVVAVSGRVDDGAPEAAEFHERVLQLVNSAAARGSSVVFDFSTLVFINSLGQRALFMAMKQGRSSGIELAMAFLQPLVRERFEIVHLDTFIPVYPSVSEAVAALGSHKKPPGSDPK